MSKYILQFPKEIKHLENSNQWLDAVKLLYNQWKSNPMDEHNLVCLIMEAWYAEAELEYQEVKYRLVEYNPRKLLEITEEQRKIYDIFCEASEIGFKYHKQGVLFNMYVGYGTEVKPLYFEKFINISQWRDTGHEMIHKAFLLDSTDRLTRLFYYASIDRRSEEYLSITKEFWSTIPLSVWGDTAVQKYFFDMFDGRK